MSFAEKIAPLTEVTEKISSMTDIWEKLIILVIGWLLGLLAPIIVDAIRRKRENKLGRDAILGELRETGRILAVAVYGVSNKQGTTDRAHLEWFRTHIDRSDKTQTNIDWLSNVDQMLAWTDEEIATRFAMMKVGQGKGMMLQKYPVPLLDSRVAALWSFDTDFQRRLLEIRQRMYRLDDMVDQQRKMHYLTFNSLDQANRAAVEENIRETCEFYCQNAKIVADLIAKLPD